MKTSLMKRAGQVFILFLLLENGCAEESRKNLLVQWKAEDAKVTSNGLVIPDKKKDNDLEGPTITGVTIIDEMEAAGGKALAFDGTQTEQIQSKFKVLLTEEFFVSLTAKLKKGESDATLIYCFNSFEIRYFPKRNKIGLIVWYNDPEKGKYMQVDAPVTSEGWIKVAASVKGENMELTVDGTSYPEKLPPETTMKLFDGRVWVGLGSGRPFIGSLGEVAIYSTKPE